MGVWSSREDGDRRIIENPKEWNGGFIDIRMNPLMK